MAHDDIIDSYLREIKSAEFFNAAEEAELHRKTKNGDKESREKLIKSVLPYVITIAKNIAKKHTLGSLAIEDLISTGNEELVKLVDGLTGDFQPERGRLTTYMTRKIYWVLDRYIKENKNTIRIPINVYSQPERLPKNLMTGCVKTLSADIPITPIDYSLQNELFKQIDKLPPRIKFVMEGKLKKRTLKDIGDEIGLSKERIRQIYNDGIKLLRETMC